MKKYFTQGSEICYEKQYHINYMKENGIESLQVFEAELERNTGYFFCQHFLEIGETGYCGRTCEAYQPRNRKSGICKHSGNVYFQTDKSIILTLK